MTAPGLVVGDLLAARAVAEQDDFPVATLQAEGYRRVEIVDAVLEDLRRHIAFVAPVVEG